MRVRLFFLSICLLFLTATLFFSCEDKDKYDVPGDFIYAPDPDAPDEPEIPKDPDPTPESLGWTIVTEYGALPAYITVYKAPDQLLDQKVKAYIAVARMDEGAKFEILGEASGSKTPTEFYNASTVKPSIVMNGGYFWDGNTMSMICRDGNLIAPTSAAWINNQNFYPTRAAFGSDETGKFAANWVYTVNGSIYAYPAPAPNDANGTPLQEPSASFPEGGQIWKGKNVLGGGPLLVKNKVLKNTWEKELLLDHPVANNPRSAIGITEGGKLIFFICEGRNMTAGVAGLTTEKVGKIMIALGCVDAMNLDGGGSSCMLINGQETIKPTDGSQRTVVTAVALK